MNVLLLTPWQNAWIPYFRDEFENRGWTFALGKHWNTVSKHDLVIHAWADRVVPVPGAKNVVFLRRYELFEGFQHVPWQLVDQLVCVNDWIADRVREVFSKNHISCPVTVIYNGTDVNRWTFKSRDHGKKLGMACHVHPKKNLPLAIQILGMLPEGYELHIAGAIQDSCTAEYLSHMGKVIDRDVFLYDHVNAKELDLWWEGMDYCLSTSLSEGNPNNVIEAMAKGIKPVIHNWPGANEQFPEDMRFSTVAQAVSSIQYGDYDSPYYKEIVEERFSLKNYAKVADLCIGLLERKAA